MAALFVFVCGVAVASAQTLSLEFHDGRVRLTAENVPVSRILAEWTRVGGTRIVNGERVPGAPVTLQLDVPGLAREQLDIGIEGDVVRVSSKDDAPRKVKAAWRFPLEIDTANSSAKLENGVLTLTLGKKVPVSNVTHLDIQ